MVTQVKLLRILRVRIVVICLVLLSLISETFANGPKQWSHTHQLTHKGVYRYLYIPSWIKADEGYAAATFTVNTIALSGRLHRLESFANGSMVAIEAKYINAELWDTIHDPYRLGPGVLRLDFFIARALDTHYYRFMRWSASLDSVLATIGASRKETKRLGGGLSIGMTFSGVTAKARTIDQLQGLTGRANSATVWITNDISDGSVKNPFKTLLNFKAEASETIFERPNGMHAFILSDGQGRLIAEAPANVATDHTVPSPYTKRLRTAISCIRCHGSNGGLQPAENHVKLLFEKGLQPTRDREALLALYGGDFSRRLRVAREDYNLAVRTITSMPSKPEGLNVKEISALVSRIYGDYRYKTVTLAQAQLETDVQALPISDPIVAALKVGIPVRREDFERLLTPVLLP